MHAHSVSGLNQTGAHIEPSFLQVPVLILPDGTKLTESAAMILQLNEDFPGKLFPEKGPARATAFRWLLFMAVNLYETVLRYDYSGRFT